MPFSHLIGGSGLHGSERSNDDQQIQYPQFSPTPLSSTANSFSSGRPNAIRSHSSGFSGSAAGEPSLSRGSSYGPTSSASVSSSSVDTPFHGGPETSGMFPAYSSPLNSSHTLPSHTMQGSRYSRYSPVDGRLPSGPYGTNLYHAQPVPSGITTLASGPDAGYPFDPHFDAARKQMPSSLPERLGMRGAGRNSSDLAGSGPWLREPAYSVHNDSLTTNMHSVPQSPSDVSSNASRSDLHHTPSEVNSRFRMESYNLSRSVGSDKATRPDPFIGSGYSGTLPPSGLYADQQTRSSAGQFTNPGDTPTSVDRSSELRNVLRRGSQSGSAQLYYPSNEPASNSHLTSGSASASAAAATAAARSPVTRDNHTLASPAFSSFSIGTDSASSRGISVFQQPYSSSSVAMSSSMTSASWDTDNASTAGGAAAITSAERERMWQSVQVRSRAADRSFLFGRISSHIFCRPSCTLDPPLPHDITFFPFPDARKMADAEDYRPCRRCKPQRDAKNEKALISVCEAARGLEREARGLEDSGRPLAPAPPSSQSPESEVASSSAVPGGMASSSAHSSGSRGVKRGSEEMVEGSHDDHENSASALEEEEEVEEEETGEAGAKKKKKKKTTKRTIKRSTFKSQAERVGMSTFHLHRTFLAVTAITPGEFSKVCQVLALQELLSIDTRELQARAAGVSMAPPVTQVSSLPLPGWTTRRAQRALGNMTLQNYGRGGAPGMHIRILSASSTAYGVVTFAWSDNSDAPPLASPAPNAGQVTPADISAFEQLHDSSSIDMASRGFMCGLLLGPDSLARMKIRFPRAIVDTRPDRILWLQLVVHRLYSLSLREDQMDDDVVHLVRRARTWVKVRDWVERGAGEDVLVKRSDNQEQSLAAPTSGVPSFASDSPELKPTLPSPSYQLTHTQSYFPQDDFSGGRGRAGSSTTEQLPSLGQSFTSRNPFTAQSSYAYADPRTTPNTPHSYYNPTNDGRQPYSAPPSQEQETQANSYFRG